VVVVKTQKLGRWRLGYSLGRPGFGHHFGLGFVDGLGAQPSPMVRRLKKLNDALSQSIKQR
jgi:hypothetical protein